MRRGAARGDALQHLFARARGDRFVAPAFQQALHRDLNRDLVVDHEDQADAVGEERRGELAGLRSRHRRRIRIGRADLEQAPLAQLGAHGQRVTEQQRQAAHDRQPQSDALGPIPFRIAELIELLEHVLLLVTRNAATGVPHLDAQVLAGACRMTVCSAAWRSSAARPSRNTG